MSAIATTLLSNMTAFGIHAMKKNGRGRIESIQQLVSLLNGDHEVLIATGGKPLNSSTVKRWMDEDGPKLAMEAAQIADQAGEKGSEKVSGGATKAQLDWKELMERYSVLTQEKESTAKPAMKLLSSAGAEAMFRKASMTSGKANREEAVHTVLKRRNGNAKAGDEGVEVSSTESSPDKDKNDDAWKRPKRTKTDGSSSKLEDLAVTLEGVFEKYSSHSGLRAQAEADEAAAKKMDAEARKEEARAKLVKAQGNADMQLLDQIERYTALADKAYESQDMKAYDTYSAKLAKLNEKLME